uniref:hypothetical protein n=1 Tax=Candidatus Ventrenecus sp. TaxID=3085654 RepID=UPI0040294392
MLKMFFLVANPVTSWFNNQIHRFLLWLDQSVYWFAAQCYQLFMKLSTAQIFTDDFFSSFAKRIYAILGVFMLFYLVYALLNAIVDPDKLTNDKGAGKIAVNLIISLTLLGLLPNIFDLAYRMQNFVLSSNLLGAVILGSDVVDVSDSESVKENNESLIRFGDYASFTVLNSFLNPENVNPTLDNGYNWYGVKEEILEDGNWKNLTLLSDAVSNGTSIDGENVVVTYRPLVSTAAGIFLIYILLSFTLDLGVRVVKFAFYELLAPIPIVLRIIPSKKGTFDKWLKQTLSVYFEVFVRVGLMYIAIYFINAITKNNTLMEMWTESTSGKLALAIIIMGVFAFAKQAPKIISDVLGIETGGLKLGIGDKLKAGGFFGAGALAGIGLAKSGFGHIGGAISGAAGGLYGSLVNGAGLAGLGYGAANGWKNKGLQFNNQRKKFYTEAMHGKGIAGWFGGQAFGDKLLDEQRNAAKKGYTQSRKNNVSKFEASKLYQNKYQEYIDEQKLSQQNALRNTENLYNKAKENFDNNKKIIEDYRNNSEYQGLMSTFENEAVQEANAKMNELVKQGHYSATPEGRAKYQSDKDSMIKSLQYAKATSELRKMKALGAISDDAQEYLKAIDEFNSYNNAYKDAENNLKIAKGNVNNVDTDLAREKANEFFANSDNKSFDPAVEQYQKDLKYIQDRSDEEYVKNQKKTRDFQTQVAAYEEAFKNYNKPGTDKGPSKPNDKK